MLNEFKKIEPGNWEGKPFSQLHSDWMLIGTGNTTAPNVMTASWGGFGVLWNLPVLYIFVRPTRYSFQLLEKTKLFNCMFFDETDRGVLQHCGKTSGREVDKIGCNQLHVFEYEGFWACQEAQTIFSCEVHYFHDLVPEHFENESIHRHYPAKDYHRMYVGKINSILTKNI